MATAKTRAPAPSAPASQQESQGATDQTAGVIEKDGDLTDLLLAELDEIPERPETEGKDKKPEARGQKPEAGESESDEDSDDDQEARGQMPEDGGSEDDLDLDADADTDADADADADSEDDAEAENETKVPKGLQKRFNELTGKLKAAEAESARLKAAQTAAQARPPTAIDSEVQAVSTAEDLAALEARYQAWEDFALANPEGAELAASGGGEPVVYTAEQIRTLLVNMRRGLRALPARTRFVEQRVAADAQAHKAYPAFDDPNSGIAKAYEAIVQRYPALVTTIPELKLLIADSIRGRALRAKATEKPEQIGKPVIKPQALPPAVGRGAPVRGKPVTAEAKARKQAELRGRAEETGSVSDLENLLESKLGG